MGSGHRNHHHMNFHIHKPHLQFLVHHHHHNNERKKEELKDVPKGCLAILVGQGEEQERFVIPLDYFSHPLFIDLLKAAEDEFGFYQNGPITIPCHVQDFLNLRGIIDKDHHHHHFHHLLCFRV